MARRIVRIFGILVGLLVLVLLAFRLAAHVRETEPRATAPDTGRMVQTAMGEVFVDTRGPETGVPILLIHGSVGWSGFWAETSDVLANAGYHALAVDLSPMGYSERDPKGDYRRTRQGQRILALVEALQVQPILLAHSFGAGAGTEALIAQPDAFRSAVIVAGAIGLDSHKTGKPLPLVLRPRVTRELAVAATITNPLALKPMLRAFLHQKHRADPYLEILQQPFDLEGTTPAIADWLPSLLTPDPEARSTHPKAFAALDLPIALIWGAEDTATPLSQGQRLQALIPGATLTVLEDLGHIPQIEDPARFQAALLAALDRL